MFNLSLRALVLKQKQEVSIKFTEVKRVSNCKKLEYLAIISPVKRNSRLWVTELTVPKNSDRTCGPGGEESHIEVTGMLVVSLWGVSCRFCVCGWKVSIFAHSDIA